MKEDYAPHLIAYGRWLMAFAAGQPPGPAPTWVAAFVEELGWLAPQASPGPLQAIQTLIDLDGRGARPAYLRPVPLALGRDDAEWPLFPTGPEAAGTSRADLYRSFLAAGADREQDFDRFFYLMRKYATTLPNTYGEPGVSLFEQWKIDRAGAGSSAARAVRRAA